MVVDEAPSEMRARDRSLAAWMSRIASGQLQMPRFQRFEAWGYADVKDLLQTILDGLPAGATLVLEIGDGSPFAHRPLQSAPEGPDRLNELLLDGQQRLTALWRSLTDSYEDGTYLVSLEERDEETGGRAVVFQKRWLDKGQRRPYWVDNPAETLERKLLPVRLLRPGPAGEKALEQWLAEATGGDESSQYRIYKMASSLRQRIATYNLPHLFLPSTTTKPIVLDVFVKMNTRQVPLTPFDIIVANVEGETGQSLHDLVASLRGRVPGIARYREPSDLVLDVAALLQDRVPNKAGYFGIEWHDMTARWDQLVAGAEAAVTFLEQERVFDATRLPTIPALAPLVALLSRVPTQPDSRGNALRLLKSYLWRSFFTDRYERASATAALQDFRALLEPVQQGANSSAAPIFDLPLPNEDQLKSAGWPKKRDRLARAILLLSLRGGALDPADGSEISVGNVGQREYHHLFPDAYLRELGLDDSKSFLALNCALITWRTNRVIGAKKPVEYLEDRIRAQALPEAELGHRLVTHAVPFAPFLHADYSAFLDARAAICHDGVEKLCAGVSWLPSAAAEGREIETHLSTHA